ncbi:MAG: hypothetical protein GY842_28165 [bacterium]|nr:hypothetical protein [bacterium]
MKNRRIDTVVLTCIILLGAGIGSGEEPGDRVTGCGWAQGFWTSDMDYYVEAITTFDDGSGEALYAGGGFVSTGGAIVNHIAKWDGSEWSALSARSATSVGVNDVVYGLTTFDDGSGEALYACGNFTSAGGVTVNRIAKWDGTQWSALSGPSGTGVNGVVFGLTTFDDGSGEALYAAGDFSTAGGLAVSRVAKWDGSAWSALSGPSGTGVSDVVYRLATFDDGSGEALYAGGNFSTAGGVTVAGIAKWDGSEWSALTGVSGTGVNGIVFGLATFDDGSGEALFVGGYFVSAGGVTVNHIARWDGTEWSALTGPSGTGVNGSNVFVLTTLDDGSGEALFVGGNFGAAGGVTTSYVAKWDGSAWSALSGPSGNGVSYSSYAFAAFDDGSGAAIYVGGNFYSAGGLTVENIARWDGSQWSDLSSLTGAGVDDNVYALTTFDDGTGEALYAGGYLVVAGGVTVKRIAKWDGSQWSGIGGPLDTAGGVQSVRALTTFDDSTGEALYAGGSFYAAGENAASRLVANNIAKWDGSGWSALFGPSATGVNSDVNALTTFDDGTGEALYVGGTFSTAGGVTVSRIAKWNGTEWSALTGSSGTGVNNWVYALTTFDDGTGEALYVGGRFSYAGGIFANHVARWDGTEWSALTGTGVNGYVYALTSFDDGTGEALYAGGDFATAGGVTVNSIAKWDGTRWSVLSGPSGIGANGSVNGFTTFDDGGGEALYAGGAFSIAGGVTVNHIASWDGAQWSALSGPSGTGLGGTVRALAIIDDGKRLHVGGDFLSAGGVASSRIGEWRCSGAFFSDGFESGDTSAWPNSMP